jgi:hypothetical protein
VNGVGCDTRTLSATARSTVSITRASCFARTLACHRATRDRRDSTPHVIAAPRAGSFRPCRLLWHRSGHARDLRPCCSGTRCHQSADAVRRAGNQHRTCVRSMQFASPLLRGGLLCGGSPLKDPLRPLELSAPSRAEVLPAAIDEVLNHPDSGPETAWGHILACHGFGDLGGGAGECPRRRMCGIRRDALHPPPLPRPARR